MIVFSSMRARRDMRPCPRPLPHPRPHSRAAISHQAAATGDDKRNARDGARKSKTGDGPMARLPGDQVHGQDIDAREQCNAGEADQDQRDAIPAMLHRVCPSLSLLPTNSLRHQTRHCQDGRRHEAGDDNGNRISARHLAPAALQQACSDHSNYRVPFQP